MESGLCKDREELGSVVAEQGSMEDRKKMSSYSVFFPRNRKHLVFFFFLPRSLDSAQALFLYLAPSLVPSHVPAS